MNSKFKKLVPGKLQLIVGLAACLTVASLYTNDTNALFTAQASQTGNSFSAATINVATSPATALFSVTNLVPGDTVVRTLQVTNSGTAGFTYNIKDSETGPSTLLFTDTVKGLQLEIKKGSTVYYTGPISSLNANSAPELAIAAGASDTLTFTVSLPTAADNAFQSLSEQIQFTFNASQLPGTSR